MNLEHVLFVITIVIDVDIHWLKKLVEFFKQFSKILSSWKRSDSPEYCIDSSVDGFTRISIFTRENSGANLLPVTIISPECELGKAWGTVDAVSFMLFEIENYLL